VGYLEKITKLCLFRNFMDEADLADSPSRAVRSTEACCGCLLGIGKAG
jgi:hypothetical protein